jgi:hypothetical protein
MSFFTFFNTKKEQAHTSSNSYLPLKEYASLHQYPFYESIPIYHRHEKEEIVSILFDSHRGLYLFDKVTWKIQDLKNATVTSATPDKKDNADIKIDSIHNFIQRKFNEVLHTEGCSLTNILILEHISKEDFEQLHPSFHSLMPKERLIFSDDTHEKIEKKLQSAFVFLDEVLPTNTLLGALFFHLNILPDNLHQENALLTEEQYHFITDTLPNFSILSGNYGTGKSTLILLKSIFELLLHPEYKIIIVMPTLAVCDLLKKQLLDIVEYAIIDIDLLSIKILSPEQVIAQHYQKLYKNESFNFAKITPKMFSHQFQSCDLIFCDDSYLLDDEFIRYLIKQQSKKRLCLVTLETNPDSKNYQLTHLFRVPSAFLQLCNKNSENKTITNQNFHLLDGNPFMHIMLVLQENLKEVPYNNILIVLPHSQFALKLLDEINGFYGNISIIYKADEGLLNQNLGQILIATMNELSHLQRENVIIVKDKNSDERHICHAIGRASKSLYLISSDLEDENHE